MRSNRLRNGLSSSLILLALVGGCSSPNATITPRSSAPAPSIVDAPPTTPAASSSLPELPADAREETLADATVHLLTKQHVLKKPIDDKLSKEAFPKYIEELDGAKLLLLQSDVDALAVLDGDIDDELKKGDLSLARKGAALIQKRREVVSKLVADLLSKPFTFTAKESFETDPKKRAYCKSEAELRDRWRQLLELSVLERIEQMEDLLAAKDKKKDGAKDDPERDEASEKALAAIPTTFEGREEKARKELAVRYESRFTRQKEMEKLEPAEQLINAVNAVYDPHTEYMAPSEKANFDIAITGTLEGIGAALGEQDHYVVVNDLIPGGAAWQQGKLAAGDLIIAVAQSGKDPVDVTDMALDKVVEMIRGPKGTMVTLTVKKPDGHIETIVITRDVVKIEASYARGAILSAGKKGEKVGYIHLPGFYGDLGGKKKAGDRNATDDVRALLAQMKEKKVDAVILDMRGNGGGILAHARDISGLFIEQGPVVQTKDNEEKVEVLSDTDPSVAFGGRLVVMVDRFSASAAEITAGALQDYQRAVVVGTSATHGKGTVQAVVDLDRIKSGGDPLGIYKVTMQEYYRVNGASTQLRGITPDILLPDPAGFVESGERTLFHPIPWSSVDPAKYSPVSHAWKIEDLVAASAARAKDNASFAKVEAFSKLIKARRDDTLEPLDRDGFFALKKKEKAELETADPKLKEMKPLFDVEALGGEATPTKTPADKKLQKRLDAWKDNLARDPWVEESMRVLADMAKKH
jgi:carboxyl-terminal processing protease